MLRILAPCFDRFYLTRFGNNPRSVPPEQLAAVLAPLVPGNEIRTFADAGAAWEAARHSTVSDDLLCVTGSVFLAAELQAAVRRSAEPPV